MWRTWALVSCLCLSVGGCFAPYRSVTGRTFDPESGKMEALRDSGSARLKCDPAQVRLRRFFTGNNYRQAVLVAEGCGQRASYLTDCSSHSPAGRTCDLVLISRVALE